MKFSCAVIFALVFSVGVAVIGWLSYGLMQDAARLQVLDQARLMMQAALSVRTYTTVQLKPLLEPAEKRDNKFLPQTVPAFAATENFNDLRKTLPDYSYKEAALNPTNPRDRAVDWEADIINAFRNKSELQELTGEREASTGRSLYFARPIRAGADCLECHSVASAAPQVRCLRCTGRRMVLAGRRARSSPRRSSRFRCRCRSRSRVMTFGRS